MDWIEWVKAVLFGIVEGITEWLPISSTGHMILLNEFVKLNVREEFWQLFLVVIQLGAILAVVVMYWGRLFPFSFKGGLRADKDKWIMWGKILIASIPAGVVGVLWDDELEALFYNYQTVAIMLILFGMLFITVENWNRGRSPRINSIAEITVPAALIIGIFQLIAAAFPGTSRSGATIIGGLIIGVSRVTAAEFTFFLAVPAMMGSSLLKLLKFGTDFTRGELSVLLIGMAVAFGVSLAVIRFLMVYIKKHDFKLFGWYRIVLGFLVLGYFTFLG